MVEELKTNPELDQLWDTIINGGFDGYYEELKNNTDEKLFELLEYLVDTWEENVVRKKITDNERVKFGSKGVIITFYTVFEEILNKRNGIAHLYSKINGFYFAGEANLLVGTETVGDCVQLLYTKEKRYTVDKDNIGELKKIHELIKKIGGDPYVASEQYLKLLQVEKLLDNIDGETNMHTSKVLLRIKGIIDNTIRGLSAGEINSAKSISVITNEIGLINEEIGLLDNKDGKKTESLNNTKKEIGQLNKAIEQLELQINSKTTEGCDFSSHCA